MKKENLKGKKLSLKKLQINKLTNLDKVTGGKGQLNNDACMYPENASKPHDGGLRI